MSEQPPVDEAFVEARLRAIRRAAAHPALPGPVRERIHTAVADARCALGEDRDALHAALDRVERTAGGALAPRPTRRRVRDAVRAVRAELDPSLVQCECGRTRPPAQPPACR